MEKNNIITIDIETTGFNSSEDDILQISIIDGNGDCLFNEYIKPELRTHWEDAMAVNHITPEMVMDKKPLSEYKQQLEKIFNNAELIVGYNSQGFDRPFIGAKGIDTGKAPDYDVMLKFAKIYGEWNEERGDYKWKKLRECAEYYNYKSDGGQFHDALEDVRATLYCYNEIEKKSYRYLDTRNEILMQMAGYSLADNENKDFIFVKNDSNNEICGFDGNEMLHIFLADEIDKSETKLYECNKVDGLVEIIKNDNDEACIVKTFSHDEKINCYAVLFQPIVDNDTNFITVRSIQMCENKERANDVYDRFLKIRENQRVQEHFAEIAYSIDDSIAENNRDYHYDLKKAYADNVNAYGEQAVNTVVAITVNNYDWDGRLSRENKQWAKSFLLEHDITNIDDYTKCRTHLAVFNGFCNVAKKATIKSDDILDLTKDGNIINR